MFFDFSSELSSTSPRSIRIILVELLDHARLNELIVCGWTVKKGPKRATDLGVCAMVSRNNFAVFRNVRTLSWWEVVSVLNGTTGESILSHLTCIYSMSTSSFGQSTWKERLLPSSMTFISNSNTPAAGTVERHVILHVITASSRTDMSRRAWKFRRWHNVRYNSYCILIQTIGHEPGKYLIGTQFLRQTWHNSIRCAIFSYRLEQQQYGMLENYYLVEDLKKLEKQKTYLLFRTLSYII